MKILLIIAVALSFASIAASVTTPVTVPANWVAGNLNLTTSAIPVKDIGACGADWAFSATGVYEYFLYKQSGVYKDLSEQMAVDCARPDGCSGGWPSEVFAYYLTHGVNFESVYPYTATDNTCAYQSTSNPAKGIPASSARQWYTIPGNDERKMAYIIFKYGWISVCLNAGPLMTYQSGIIRANQCSSTTPDHCVIFVGYGRDTTLNINYWIGLNNWGTSTVPGYFKIERGTNACGLANAYENYRVHLM